MSMLKLKPKVQSKKLLEKHSRDMLAANLRIAIEVNETK